MTDQEPACDSTAACRAYQEAYPKRKKCEACGYDTRQDRKIMDTVDQELNRMLDRVLKQNEDTMARRWIRSCERLSRKLELPLPEASWAMSYRLQWRLAEAEAMAKLVD